MQIELELLAPAKDKRIGIAAVDCGTDSVYIAGPEFGARAEAGNSFEDIAELCSYAAKFGVKVYAAINTILYDYELERAEEYVWKAYKAGCSAIIVQDLALLKMSLPPIQLFASTQTDIRTPEKAALLEKLGFQRLILARELSLKQIKAIREATHCSLEFFVHGALCVCASGQCYLSKYLTERSANRGECIQACRSNYDVEDACGNLLVKNGPILSLKDLNLSGRIEELADAGITSFKIEGRLKNISYVRNVTSYYNNALNSLISKYPDRYRRASHGRCSGGFKPDAALTFNRGFTEIFVDGVRGKWNSELGAKYLGEPVGQVLSAWRNHNGFLQFKYSGENKIVNGDGLCFVSGRGEITGIRASSCSGNEVATADNAENADIKSGTKIFRNFNFAFEKELEKNHPSRIIDVHIDMRLQEKSILMNCNTCGISLDLEIEAAGFTAKNKETALQSVRNQLGKSSGIFNFTVGEIGGDVLFYPVSVLNSARRSAAEKIAETLFKNFEEKRNDFKHSHIEFSKELQQVAHKALACYQKKDGGLSYLANCSNRLSAEVYKKLGYSNIEQAFELCEPQEAVLMRTKYCIRYQLGLCKKGKDAERLKYKDPFYLVNGEKRLRAEFDCAACEMVIKKE